MEEIINQIDENTKVIEECEITINKILQIDKLVEELEEKNNG